MCVSSRMAAEDRSVGAGATLGVYLSVPFCRSKCTYCNFASGVYPASDHDRYVERLVEDVRAARRWAARMGLELPERVDSVYLGGGTPVLLSPENLRAIFAALRGEFALAPEAEVTIECAPGQMEDETLEALVECGANRFSLGVQSMIDRECAVSGRLHGREDVLADVRRLREAGIENVNLDLLAGLAGQTMASWRESLEAVVATGVPHVSVYMLEIDEDSRLGRELMSGGGRYYAELVPSEDAIAAMYEMAVDALEATGLRQYEISNFAREGWASRHNLRYWRREPYVGFGLDAASMLFALPAGRELPAASLRWTMTADMARYLERGAGDGGRLPVAEQSWLSVARQVEESWFLGLRCKDGVSAAELRAQFGAEAVERSIGVARGLVKGGLLAEGGLLASEAGERFRLTARGRMISNEVFAEFLDSDS